MNIYNKYELKFTTVSINQLFQLFTTVQIVLIFSKMKDLWNFIHFTSLFHLQKLQQKFYWSTFFLHTSLSSYRSYNIITKKLCIYIILIWSQCQSWHLRLHVFVRKTTIFAMNVLNVNFQKMYISCAVSILILIFIFFPAFLHNYPTSPSPSSFFLPSLSFVVP